MREKKLTIAAVVLVCIGLMAYLVVFSVRVDEVAAQYRAGKVIRIIRPMLGEASDAELQYLAKKYPDAEIIDYAHWFFKLPWPFDRVEKFDQRVRNVDGPASQVQLPDGNHVVPQVYATWRIYDPVAFQKSLRGDVKNAEQRLRTIIGNSTSTVFGTHKLDDVVNTAREKLKFDDIEQAILDGVHKDLVQGGDAYGIEVLSLGIQRIALPDDTTAAVFKRMVAERTMVAQKLRAEGERIKRTKIAEARQKRDEILAKAEAEAKDIRAEAEAQAAQFYDVFAKNEHLAIFLRQLEALRKITAAASEDGHPITLVLSSKTEPFALLEKGPQAEEHEQAPSVPLAQEVTGAETLAGEVQ